MDTMNAITEMISTVGFPIVCFIMSGWYVKYREDKNDEKVSKIIDAHADENKRITEAVNNNTLALQKLTDKLGG